MRALLTTMIVALATHAHALDDLEFAVSPGSQHYGGMGKVMAVGALTFDCSVSAPKHYIASITLVPDPTVLWNGPQRFSTCKPEHYQRWIYIAAPQHSNTVMTTRFAGSIPACESSGSGKPAEPPTFAALIAHADLDADTDNDNADASQRQTARTVAEDRAEDQEVLRHGVVVLQNAGYEEGGGAAALIEPNRQQDYEINGIIPTDPELVKANLTIGGKGGYSTFTYNGLIRLYQSNGTLITSGTAVRTEIGEHVLLIEGIAKGKGQIDLTFIPDGAVNKCVDQIFFEVRRAIKLNVTTFIPFNHVVVPLRGNIFSGDDRAFSPTSNSFRTRQTVIVVPLQLLNTSGIKTGTESQLVGVSHEYDSAAIADGAIDASDIPIGTATASPAGMSILVTDRQPNYIELKFEGSMPNPLLIGAPDIDWVLRVRITDDNGTYRYRVTGDHDGFPAYEVYSDGVPMYQFAPSSPDEAIKLIAPMDVTVLRSGNLP